MFASVSTCCGHGVENNFCSQLACKANSCLSSTTRIRCPAIVHDTLSRPGQLAFALWRTFSPHPCVKQYGETICAKESKRFRYRELQAPSGNCKRQHWRKVSMLPMS